MSEYTLRILNQSLISEIDKEMLFIQNGVWGDFLIRQYNLSEDNFSFRFLGQK